MSNKTHKLEADKREIVGRKVKRLRAEGKVPANIFGTGIKSVSITVENKNFKKTFDEAGETGIIEISVGKASHPVLVTGVQYHPVTDNILHIDFRQVDLKAKITANVPVEIIGEAPAEKTGLGVLVQQLSEIEVQALPLDLPDKFEVDVSKLETLDDSILVSDLKVDSTKVEILDSGDRVIANVSAVRQEEEEPVSDDETAEGEESAETSEEGKKAETPSEGSEKKEE